MPKPVAARLSLKHLRLIAAIAEHRQLSVAASVLSITQPAASRSLAEVEAMVGAALFERHPRGMRATLPGEGLARRARLILDEVGRAAEEVGQLRQGRGGVVRIGTVTGAAVGYVVPAIRQLMATAPGVEIHVEVATSDELAAGLSAMRLDIMLGRIPAAARPGDFAVQRAGGERVRLIAGAGHRLAGQARVALADLAGDAWIMQGPGAPIRRAVEDGFLDQGLAPPARVINSASLLVTLAMLREDDVVTPVSQEVAGLLTGAQGNLVILPFGPEITVAPYSLVTLRNRSLSPAAARCHALLSQALREGPARS